MSQCEMEDVELLIIMKYHSLTNVTIVPNTANKSDRSPFCGVFSNKSIFYYKNNYLKNLFLSIKTITPTKCNRFNFTKGGLRPPLEPPYRKICFADFS